MRYHSFYNIRTRLERNAQITGKILDLGSEAYTTAACPGCGHHNPSVGGAKFPPCLRRDADPACGLWDRDCGSARSILLLHVGKYLPDAADPTDSNSVFFEPLRLP